MIKKLMALCAVLGLITACSDQGPSKPTGTVKVGDPYVVMGKKYYPEYDANYDKVGVASWYGPDFHGKYTANGEVFDQNDLTAAHPTLPMPSLVRVTNLHNGKSAIIRVNDRGPFKDDRIIDLSRKSAERLGIVGLAKVRVTYLQKETEEYLSAIRAGQDFDMFAYNDHPPAAKIVESTHYSSYNSEQGQNPAAPVMSVQQNVEPAAQPEETVAQPVVLRNMTSEPSSLPAAGMLEKPVYQPAVQHEQQYVRKPIPQQPPEQDLQIQQPPAAPPPPPEESPSAGGNLAMGNYTIQAGLFSSENNARRLADKLSSIAQASLDTVELMGKQLWRVRVGAFDTRKSAEEILASVRQEGKVPDAKVVRR